MRPFREELKYVVHHSTRTALLERWRRHLVKDPHTNEDAVTPVLSQYYDSPNLAFFEEKVDGIRFRNKVRLRAYGLRYDSGGAVVLEIKQRLEGRVRKIRMRIEDFQPRHLDPCSWRFASRDDESAFASLRERYRLKPSAQTFYMREAYESVVEPTVRVTFDTCLAALHPGEILGPGALVDESRRLLPDTLAILEVKATAGLPAWVMSGVRVGELTQRPVPKYVMAVTKLRLPDLTPGGAFS